ncbi:condensation domain-containing protein [Streptantibioticus ferralitis]|uniref:Condensation domain-containing protein n=1 Tax=Streptantibioticus ferralitis TaxID=236510 RepID=A0ABT5ZCD0_9ACTN|nr:condensation domain-containing protein [Streptantibioticus ferralitis]MDF2261507.1 condensation domain-containing protein [Streptantibioticus ferralitis]
MFNLSRSQEIVWLHEELFPDSPAYNFTAALDLHGPLDEPALRQSLATVLTRHEAFQLELDPEAFPPTQHVNDACALRYRTVDLTGTEHQEAAFEELWRKQHDAPFDTAEAPMVRWTLIRLAEDHHRLLQTEHHLVHDGWSFGLVLRDLFTTYRALTQSIPADLPEPRSYLEHVRQSVATEEQPGNQDQAVAYWRSTLNGAAFDLPLSGLVNPGRVRDIPHGDQLRQLLEPELAERLRSAARRDGHTPFSVLLTLFAELLRRQSGRADLVIGSAVGNRPPGFRETVGMFVNTIPLRIRLQPDDSALEAVDEVTEVLIRSLPHQGVPVQDLARELGVHSSAGLDNPLFHVMFSAHDAPLPHVEGLDLQVSIHEAFNTGTSRFDLDVVLIPDSRRTVNARSGPGGMLLIWDFATDLYDSVQIGGLQRQFSALLEAYLADGATGLAALAAAANG